ncbi:host-nuclease inhibitor Gam family protein [Bacillus atrophaeus]|uniref:host-nuclease inhibitor Gam family protein n=1 Tax=Bacillus atrophaeus TaxID=1452 RepID=UPI002E1A2137|nr:host-nuclease inhibitor Gam family protein [Bacillus atrophaeus]
MAINEVDVQNMHESLAGNSFLKDLLSFVEETEVEEFDLTNIDESFSIQTMDQANYIARKLREIREERKEAEETAKAQIAAYERKVSTWLEKVSNPLNSQEQRFLQMLEVFAAEKLEGSNKKSLKLIEGTLQFRKQHDKYEYEENTLLAFAESNLPKYIKTKPSVDKAKLKKDAEVKDGQLYIGDNVVQGVTVIPQPVKFDVK